MIVSFLIVWLLAAGLVIATSFSDRNSHRSSIGNAWEIAKPIFVRLPIAMVAASFLGQLLPQAMIGSMIGEDTGLRGLLLAVAIGALLPGGPLIMYPIAAAIYSAGAGTPQIIALLTTWSLFAVHRLFSFEIPAMGIGFVGLRVAISVVLPFVAGLLAFTAAFGH